MKSIKAYIMLAAFVMTGRGCEALLHTDATLPDQEYFFLYEYINYAWGYQHSGWLMDSSGTARYFSVPEKWMVPDTDAAIDISGIEHYLVKADSVITVVDRSILSEKVKLIEAAARGTLGEPENVMADAGTRSYYALQYDPDQAVYERILLKQEGDWEIDNFSSAAGELAEWMQSVTE
ncbi:MAG: hypothetical protein P1P82_15705 [Bacteroidales bacterium]|nr:hypothetical protein [Bacteroidales bacterium]MDT8432575.1 hypothetical protein [Bacteroidales bacterium]